MKSEKTGSQRRRGYAKLLLWVVIFLFVAGSALMLSLLANKTEEKVEDAHEEATLVRVAEVEAKDVRDIVGLPGRVEAFRDVDLAAENNGRIMVLNVDKGDEVKRGEVLLRIDDRVWRAMRKKAAAQMEDAKRDLERFKELEKSGAVSESDFDDIRLRRDTAEADLEQAEAEVADCVVTSPIDGIVNDRFVEMGEYVNEGQAVFEVLDMDRVKIGFEVPERDITAMDEGDEIPFRVQALDNRSFTGTVHFVASKASRESNTFSAELLLDNAQGALRPGMIADIDLPRRWIRDAVVLPIEAVVTEEGEHIVFAAVDGRAERRVVDLGTMLDREVVIDSGAEPGERVVVEGQRSIADGHLLEFD